ncbi:PH domain-containing protein [Chloroflexota bacterium]
MEKLLYQDKTHKDIWLKLILAIPVIIMLILALIYMVGNDITTAYEMLISIVFIVAVLWFVIPRQYLIFDDKVKILLGGPFSFNISFNTIKTARIPKGTTFGINFPSSLSSKHAVEILRHRRMSVNITPDNRDLFLQTLEKAMDDWRIYQKRETR